MGSATYALHAALRQLLNVHATTFGNVVAFYFLPRDELQIQIAPIGTSDIIITQLLAVRQLAYLSIDRPTVRRGGERRLLCGGDRTVRVGAGLHGVEERLHGR